MKWFYGNLQKLHQNIEVAYGNIYNHSTLSITVANDEVIPVWLKHEDEEN